MRSLVALAAAAVCPAAGAAPYTAKHPLPVAAVCAPGVISTADDESHPTFTPDGTTLFFLKNTPTFRHWTIVESHYAKGRWGTPEVAPLSGQYNDADVFLAKDGSVFFISNRPVNGQSRNDTDIWVMRRNGAGYAEPEHIDAVSSAKYEW